MSGRTVYVDLRRSDRPSGTPGKRWQGWSWIALNAGNHEPLAISTEKYTNRQDCLDAIRQLFGTDATVHLREPGAETVLLRAAASADAINDAAEDDDEAALREMRG